MGARLNLSPHRDWIVERLQAGDRLRDVADVLGCCPEAVRQQAKKAGYRIRRAAFKHEGEWTTFTELAERTGIQMNTLWLRYQRGKRGKELVQPLHIGKCRHYVYYLDLSYSAWQEVAEEARRRGIRETYNKLRLPMGAISAAVRGQWERLE